METNLEIFEPYGKIIKGPKNYFVKLTQKIPNHVFVQLYDKVTAMGGSFVQQGEYGAFEVPLTTKVKKCLKELWLSDLVAAPAQIRTTIPDLEFLINSMKQRGLLLPIIVTPSRIQTGKYVVIDGNLRWRAAMILDWTKIDAIIEDDLSYLEVMEKILLCNIKPEVADSESIFTSMAKFLTKIERRQLLNIFLIIESKGNEVNSTVIKNAAKDIQVHRTALRKAYDNKERGLLDETAGNILEFIIFQTSQCEKNLVKQQINDLINKLYLRLEKTHNIVRHQFFHSSN